MQSNSIEQVLTPEEELSVSQIDNEFSKSESQDQKEEVISQDNLRNVCWITGTHFPMELNQEGMILLAVNPHLGFIQWHINVSTVEKMREEEREAFERGCKLVIRVYDVSGIEFNGLNAVSQFDIDINNLSGNYYLNINRSECNLLAEVGFRFSDNRFLACVRSNVMYFDRPRRSSRFDFSGLYVSHGFTRIFTVENAVCGSVFDRMNRSLEYTGNTPLSVAVFLNESAISGSIDTRGPIADFLEAVLAKCRIMRAVPYLLTPRNKMCYENEAQSLINRAKSTSKSLLDRFTKVHSRKSFNCIQCHDWYSAPAALEAASVNGLPITGVLHSIELERANFDLRTSVSQQIESWERKLITTAENILVSRESTRQTIIQHYKKDPDRVVVVADQIAKAPDSSRDREFLCRKYGLNEKEPIFLFAGEMAHHNGVDLLVSVLPEICHEFRQGQFVFAGEGYLKGEMEGRVWHSGIAHRCRFIGDVPSEIFAKLITICDSVIIPARGKQDGGLADMALKAGKPVIATHQAGLHHLVKHGINGLLFYDNPGSVIWALKEMISRPIPVLPRTADDPGFLQTAECIAAMYITYWACAVAIRRGVYFD